MKSFSIFSIRQSTDSSGKTVKAALKNNKELSEFLDYCTHYDDMYINAAYGDEKACIELAEHFLLTKVELPPLTDSSLLALVHANKCVFVLADVDHYFRQRPLPRDSALLKIIRIMLRLSPTLTVALD